MSTTTSHRNGRAGMHSRDGSDVDVDDDLRSNRSYAIVTDRTSSTVALVLDPDGAALRAAASPVADANAAAVAAGADFRYVPPSAGAGGRTKEDESARKNARQREEEKPEKEDEESELEPTPQAQAHAKNNEESTDTPPRLKRFAAGGGDAVDDLLCSLSEMTHRVLVHFFPNGYENPSSPTADESSNSTSDDSLPRHEMFASKAAKTTVPAVYALPFLHAEDARAGTTLPTTLVSASDDADADTSIPHLLQLLSRLVGPVAVTQVLRTSMGIVTTMFMGHFLTTEQFAAAATGLSFTNLTALNIGNGFSAALDTLATQEHGRRKHSPEIVAILCRGMICTFAVYVPIAVFYLFCEPVLAALIHADLVADTAYFLQMSVLIAMPMIINNNLIKFAQSQKVTQLGVVASTVGLVVLIPLLFLCRGMGIPGIIVALSIDRFVVLAAVSFFLVRNEGLSQCWRGRSVQEHFAAVFYQPKAFLNFVRVGLPILGANCADSWAFEALGIVAAHIGTTSAAAWNVIMAIYSQLFALHVGIAAASAIRVGNAVGARKGLLARRYVIATIIFSVSCTFLCVLGLWLLGRQLFQILQSNPVVSERGGELNFLAGVAFSVDSLFYVMQGPFRGVGYNGMSLLIVATGMWGVTVPMAIIFGVMYEYDVEGILLSLFAGMSVTFPAQVGFLLLCVPWQKLDRKCQEEEANTVRGEVTAAAEA